MSQRIEEILRRLEPAKSTRGNWNRTFQDIADRILPQAADFEVQRSDGEDRTELMFDATAALANMSRWNPDAPKSDSFNSCLPERLCGSPLTNLAPLTSTDQSVRPSVQMMRCGTPLSLYSTVT